MVFGALLGVGLNILGGALGGGGRRGGGGNRHTYTNTRIDRSTNIGGHNVAGNFVGGNIVHGNYNSGTIVRGHSGGGGNRGDISVARDTILRASDLDLDIAIGELAEGSAERREAEEARLKMMEAEELRRREDDERMLELNSHKHDVLLVESVDKKVEQNATEHHCDRFHCTDLGQLVVRRGQEFTLALTFQRPYVPKVDDLNLVFKLGNKPNSRYGTYQEMKLIEDITTKSDFVEEKQWRSRITSIEGKTLTVAVYAPPDAVIGQWEVSVVTIKQKEKEEYEFVGTDDVIILYNPWCPDDQVYYKSDPKDLDEYILNDSGAAFTGSYNSIKPMPWSYGQFQKDILQICLHLLRRANYGSSARTMSDPVLAARSLSWVVNECLLEGKWCSDPKAYKEGVAPYAWKGSVSILRKYMESKAPVKYGQCWVFSHVLTTICRAVGLPCRSVTNFASCHDTDESMTQDRYVDAEGELMEYGDSQWNFHVWNDVWINRPDLDKQLAVSGKYDGWHAFDATPQELSGRRFQCGPSPLAAIKEGEVSVGYDTKFIFAEVNADVCTWTKTSPPVLVNVDTSKVGKNMSTKFPDGKAYPISHRERGRDIRMDVTKEYKYDEGSIQERDVVRKAVGQGSMADYYFKNESGVKIELTHDASVPVGQKVPIKGKLTNSSGEPRTLRVQLVIRPANYWGGLVHKTVIAKASEEFVLKPQSTRSVLVEVPASAYLRHCDEAVVMRVLAQCDVTGFKTPLFTSDVVSATLPDIAVEGPDGVPAGEEFPVTVTVGNPLTDHQMTRCVLTLDGDQIYPMEGFKLKESTYRKVIGDLKPGEKKTLKLKVKATVIPRRSKVRTLAVGLSSNELPDLHGSFTQLLA